MNYFATDRFVLTSDSARALYKDCKDTPIFDFHNHLPPQLLYENRNFKDMAEFWLGGDHYIWRAMRLAGVEERCITGDASGIKNKVQLGAAWWFNDHQRGMMKHLSYLMENALLPGFVGMLTDSRSLGTFVRHDYFRRILCNAVGQYVESGEYPLEAGKKLVNNICFQNAVEYFGGDMLKAHCAKI